VVPLAGSFVRSRRGLRTSETPRAALPLQLSASCARSSGKRRGDRIQARRFGDRRSPVVAVTTTVSTKHAVGQSNTAVQSGQTVAYARGVRRKRSLTPRKMNGDSTMRTAATPQRVSALPQWTDAQEDGLACVVCGLDYTSPAAKGVISMPVGRCATTGSSVFACASCCGEGDE